MLRRVRRALPRARRGDTFGDRVCGYEYIYLSLSLYIYM